jgi:hypothetical protein
MKRSRFSDQEDTHVTRTIQRVATTLRSATSNSSRACVRLDIRASARPTSGQSPRRKMVVLKRDPRLEPVKSESDGLAA